MSETPSLKVVQPMTAKTIWDISMVARRALGATDHQSINILRYLELGLPSLIPNFRVEVDDDSEMPGIDGSTMIGSPVITFRDQVYENLRRGDPEARFTAAHELGHVLIHCQAPVQYAFRSEYVEETDPEWQADQFAMAFLMPPSVFRKCKTVQAAVARFHCTEHHVREWAEWLGHEFIEERPNEPSLFDLLEKKEERENSHPS